jgi:signal transduction histidine kinase/HD-like signal output (HDOD) protein
MMQTEAIQLLQKTDADKLPTLPHVLLHLLDACQDENVSFEKLANVISKDPALCVKIMSACGSACTSIDNLEKSLSRLGINTIKSIAITSAVQQFFARSNQERSTFLKQHWHHSIYCGAIAEQLAEYINYKEPDEAWFAGLLHDAGQLIMEAAYPTRYTAAFAQLSEDDYFHDIEIEEFETTHYCVGANLFKKHDGNPFLADAIMYHHEPVDKLLDAHPLVKIVNLANLLSREQHQENPDEALAAAEQLFGLSPTLVDGLLKNCIQKVTSIAEEFEVEFGRYDDNGNTAQKIIANDQLKQVHLAEQIRNIAMLDGVHQHLSRVEGKQALLLALKQNISILFGINNCILFLYDAGIDKIQALSSNDNDSHLQDIKIPLEPGRSIVVDALLEMRAINSFEDKQENLSIVDRQLIGLNTREGLLCMPLIVHNAAIGTLVLGIDEAQLPSLLKQQGLFKRFANEIANTISSSLAEFRGASDLDKTADPDKVLKARAREVVHEVRNPLSIINNYLEILSIKLEGDDPAKQDLETIRSEIQRINTILEKLSQPIQVDASETVPVDVNALIADLSHMFQTSLFAAHDIEISLNLDESMPPMLTNADAIKQVYTNLVKNAVEALPAEGLVMVYTQDQVNVDGKPHFEICVADDGPGIPAEILPHLFTPIQTTKGEGHAGLGLTIVKNLVNELHGSISCRSSDKGTSFHILLPRNIQN